MDEAFLLAGLPPVPLVPPAADALAAAPRTPYVDVRRQIHNGDVLLFRRQPGDLGGEAIATAGRTIYSHAALAGWWDGDLMALETIQWHGGRSLSLDNLVLAQPGRIDVYGIAPEFRVRYDRRAAVHAARLATGKPYGRWALLYAGLRHLPVVRLFVRPEMDDRANGLLPFCSMGVARWMRAGGVDLVPNLADRLTEPGDLARSAALTKRFTLW